MPRRLSTALCIIGLVVVGAAGANPLGHNIENLKARAARGDVTAWFNLGVLYDEGRTVPQDDKEALKWYRKAANKGHAEAQFRLGVVYGGASSRTLVSLQVCGYGDGSRSIPRDKVRAYMWFNLAASHAHKDVRAQALIPDRGHEECSPSIARRPCTNGQGSHRFVRVCGRFHR